MINKKTFRKEIIDGYKEISVDFNVVFFGEEKKDLRDCSLSFEFSIGGETNSVMINSYSGGEEKTLLGGIFIDKCIDVDFKYTMQLLKMLFNKEAVRLNSPYEA